MRKLSILSALLFLSICPLHADSQTRELEKFRRLSVVGQFPKNRKTIFTFSSLASESVKFSFKLKGQPLDSNRDLYPDAWPRPYEEFDGDPDWLKDITVSLRNISGKTITYVVLNLTFPEASKNGQVALHQIFIGVDPDRMFLRPEVRLLPSEAMEIALSERYAGIKALVEMVGRMPVENVTQMQVDLHAALFDDGTRFEGDTFFKRNPDPNGPRKWLRVNRVL